MAPDDGPSQRPLLLVARLLAAAWLASVLSTPLPLAGVLGGAGAGFLASIALTAAALLAWAVQSPRGLARSVRDHRAVLGAAGLAWTAYLVSALGAGAPLQTLLACARAGALAVFALAIVLAGGLGTLDRAFAVAAMTLLGAYVALFVAGQVFPAVGARVFLALPHQHLSQLPRFAAITGIPGSTGAWALAAVGLVGPIRRPALRRTARVAGALAAIATLSPATLALPAVLAAALVRARRARVVTTFVLAALGIAPLYVHLLAVRWGEHEVVVSRVHPSYDESGLGAALMPIHDARLAGLGVRFHLTAYAALVARAASCFAEHPLLGVGPQEFEQACPVVTMNTYGEWSASRRPHNQLGEIGVELGAVGLVLFAGAWCLVRRDLRWEPPDRWCAGAAVGLVVCSFSGAFLLSLPALGFFALHLRRRHGGTAPAPAY